MYTIRFPIIFFQIIEDGTDLYHSPWWHNFPFINIFRVLFGSRVFLPSYHECLKKILWGYNARILCVCSEYLLKLYIGPKLSRLEAIIAWIIQTPQVSPLYRGPWWYFPSGINFSSRSVYANSPQCIGYWYFLLFRLHAKHQYGAQSAQI